MTIQALVKYVLSIVLTHTLSHSFFLWHKSVFLNCFFLLDNLPHCFRQNILLAFHIIVFVSWRTCYVDNAPFMVRQTEMTAFDVMPMYCLQIPSWMRGWLCRFADVFYNSSRASFCFLLLPGVFHSTVRFRKQYMSTFNVQDKLTAANLKCLNLICILFMCTGIKIRSAGPTV